MFLLVVYILTICFEWLTTERVILAVTLLNRFQEEIRCPNSEQCPIYNGGVFRCFPYLLPSHSGVVLDQAANTYMYM
jgi:hypothetical protein